MEINIYITHSITGRVERFELVLSQGMFILETRYRASAARAIALVQMWLRKAEIAGGDANERAWLELQGLCK